MGQASKIRLPSERDFARALGLRYVSDHKPGFTRKRFGKNFRYFDVHGRRIRRKNVLRRIHSLVIPPAWENVWICRSSRGHIQVTGRDARGRKQYRYHPKWSQGRSEFKFRKLKRLCDLLPPLRARVDSDLRKSGLPREKVLAAVVKLLQLTHIRVGNDTYAEENNSYGLTTICNRHARISGPTVNFCFRGKSGVLHKVSFRDARLSRIVHACKCLPGQALFEYVDKAGKIHDVRSTDVNDYLREASGGELTAKELRTWGGTVKALEILKKLGPCSEKSDRALKARERFVIRETAEHLRNTVAVCRKYYVHPRIFEADRCGKLHQARPRKVRALSSEEQVLAALL